MRVLAAAVLSIASTAALAAPRPLALRRVDLDLPGAPAAVVAADLDRDGRRDLLLVVAQTTWGSISNDRVEDLVAVMEVVPALFDRREARGFLAQAGGSYRALPPLALPARVLAIAAGPPAHPVLALTDDGLAEIRWDAGAPAPALDLVPLIAQRSAFAGAGTFMPDVRFVRDVDGDGALDAVLPTPGGLAIHPGIEGGGFAPEPSYRGGLPGDRVRDDVAGPERAIPVPDFFDVTGDGLPDLVVRDLGASPQRVAVAKGEGGGRFGPASWTRFGCLTVKPPNEKASEEQPLRVAWFGDLDQDGRAEVVTREGIDTGKSEMKQAKKPKMRYRVFRMAPDLTVDPAPARTFEAFGYAFTGAFQDEVDLEFLDLDADGRKDLVTVTLDFSIFQALRALTAKKIGIGLEFHVVAQKADGSFVLVPDQTLDEKLRLDLNHLEISRLGQFQGDFDGDGRIDFVHLGKGTTVTIHRGQSGGRYPEKPDLSIALDEEPQDVLLVRVHDLDGDGRSDLAITRTLTPDEAETTAPVRLELRLSGEAR